MLFDWFTLAAQLVNFLILVWLLKRFLYKPILNAIDEREKLIAMHLQDAESIKAKASKELDNYQQKNSLFDEQRQELLNQAIGEVNTQRQKLLEQTRNEVETLRLRLMETLKAEQLNMSSEIIRRTRTEVFAIARKTLADLASVDLEDQMASVFIRRLKTLNPDEQKLLYSALRSPAPKIAIRSTFDLSPAQQTAIQNVLKNALNLATDIQFETAPHLVSGIELITNGYKVAWTIEDYLGSLEAHITQLLNEKTELKAEKMSLHETE
jgi:F-type H+-transporting ATPase subunit b